MSEEIIKVLDYLGEKFGIAIDWASTNVLPQIQTILHKLTIYEIVISSIWTAAGLIGLICCSYFILQMMKGYKSARELQTSNFWWNYWKYDDDVTFRDEAVVATVFLCIMTFISLVVFIICFDDLLRWCIIPEVQLFKYIQDLIP